jgi:hypothetical protein
MSECNEQASIYKSIMWFYCLKAETIHQETRRKGQRSRNDPSWVSGCDITVLSVFSIQHMSPWPSVVTTSVHQPWSTIGLVLASGDGVSCILFQSCTGQVEIRGMAKGYGWVANRLCNEGVVLGRRKHALVLKF